MVPEIDKEFMSLIPPLSPDEYTQLEQNLLSEGCRDRLVVWGSLLIDGHNRLEICTKHHIPFEVTEHSFSDRDEAMRYIILNQFGRRNLSLGERSILALRLEPLYKAEAKANQRQSPGRGQKGLANLPNLNPVNTREKIADLAGVANGTIKKVKKIVNDGTPEQINRIKAGGKGNSVSAVFNEVRASQPQKKEGTSANDDDKLMDANSNNDETSAAGDPTKSHGEEDVLKQIKSYVADLKNPDIERPFTPELFLAEYEAFAQGFIRSIEVFADDPYSEIYPLLSKLQQKAMTNLDRAMVDAIEQQSSRTGKGDNSL